MVSPDQLARMVSDCMRDDDDDDAIDEDDPDLLVRKGCLGWGEKG